MMPVRLCVVVLAFLAVLPVFAQEPVPAAEPETKPEVVLPALGPLAEAEQSIRKTFTKFFKRTRNPKMHEQGWAELARHMHDPRVYDLMFELFADKPFEMQRELVELFVRQETDDADVAIAWAAVFNEDEQLRTWAGGRLVERVGEEEPSYRVQRVLELGLLSGEDDPAVASSSLVRQFGLVNAIPYLIQAQAEPRRRDVRRGAIAQIVVGTQQAFVANLTPVVANNAVGFQPTIGVVTNGVVLRVMDAVVWAYRTEVHRNLVGLADQSWGQSTGHMGYDQRAWYDWYENEFKPELAARAQDGAGGG